MIPSFRLYPSVAQLWHSIPHSFHQGQKRRGGDMSLPGTCRSAPQAASSRSVSGDARTESGAGKGPRPRVDFLHNLLLMINNGDLFFDDGEKSESERK